MTDEREPPRWTAPGSEVPHELRELVAASRARVGKPDEVARLSEQLSRALGPAAGLPAAAPKAAAIRMVSRYVLLWGGAGVLAGLALTWPTRNPEPPAATAVPEAVSDADEPAVAVPSVSAPPAPSANPLVLEPTAPHAAPVQKSTPAKRDRDRVQTPARASSEADLLERARAALARSPNESLALTREHLRRFPKGALAEEREVIAIEALQRLGDTSAAERRALEFERRYRGSVHQGKVESR